MDENSSFTQSLVRIITLCVITIFSLLIIIPVVGFINNARVCDLNTYTTTTEIIQDVFEINFAERSIAFSNEQMSDLLEWYYYQISIITDPNYKVVFSTPYLEESFIVSRIIISSVDVFIYCLDSDGIEQPPMLFFPSAQQVLNLDEDREFFQTDILIPGIFSFNIQRIYN